MRSRWVWMTLIVGACTSTVYHSQAEARCFRLTQFGRPATLRLNADRTGLLLYASDSLREPIVWAPVRTDSVRLRIGSLWSERTAFLRDFRDSLSGYSLHVHDVIVNDTPMVTRAAVRALLVGCAEPAKIGSRPPNEEL
jgi:hypothetical protein